MMNNRLGILAGATLAIVACGSSGSSAPTGNNGGAGGSGGANAPSSAGSSGSQVDTSGGALASGGTGETDSAGSSTAGMPAAGSAGLGGSAGAGAAGGLPPIEPDLTGLVETSGHWVLLKLPGVSGSSTSADLELLDSNQMHPANAGGPFDIIGSVSPDGRTYFFSDGDGLAVSSRVIRLTENGFVPAKSLADYATTAGAMRVLSWSFDSRFALVSNGSSPSTIEVVDVILGKRLHSEQLSGHDGAFAADSYWYWYDGSSVFQPRLAQLGANGSSQPTLLPAKASNVAFDAEAASVFYTLGQYPEPTTLHVRALSTGQDSDVAIAGAGEELAGPNFVSAPGQSVVAVVQSGETQLARRVYLGNDPKAATTVSAVAKYVDVWASPGDGNDLLVSYFNEKTFDLVRLEPPFRKPLLGKRFETDKFLPFGMVGKHAFYLSSDGLHVASLNAAGDLDDTVVSTAQTRPCAQRFTYSPAEKLAFLEGDGEKLVFVDLSSTPPVVVGSITPSTGYKVACPSWADADTTATTTEYVEGMVPRNAWVMRWQRANAPEAPKLVASGVLSVEAVRLR